MSKQPRSLFDEVLELALYVPVGIAVRALEQVPGLAAAGRDRIGGQVEQARVIGRFAVGLARSKAARSFATGPARPPSPPPPVTSAEERSAPARTAPGGARRETSADERGERPAAPRGAASPAKPAARARQAAPHAIPDYDALSASQVVPRLQGLTRDELTAVGHYEAATRRRRTILNRVAQLERELGGL